MKHKKMKVSGPRLLEQYLEYAGFNLSRTKIFSVRNGKSGAAPTICVITHDGKLWEKRLESNWRWLQSDDILTPVIEAYAYQFGQNPYDIANRLGVELMEWKLDNQWKN